MADGVISTPKQRAKVVRATRASKPKIMGSVTTVLVGKNEQSVMVHMRLLTASSFYLKNQVNKLSQATADKAIKLRAVSVGAFEVYVAWLYTQKVCTADAVAGTTASTESDVSDDTPVDSELEPEYACLRNCLILADMIDDPQFHNAVIDCLIEATTTRRVYPTRSSLADVVFAQLPKGSPARQLIVDFWVYCGSSMWYEQTSTTKSFDVESGPKEFWVAVAHGLTRKREVDKAPWVENRCKYHIHVKGEPKCS